MPSSSSGSAGSIGSLSSASLGSLSSGSSSASPSSSSSSGPSSSSSSSLTPTILSVPLNTYVHCNCTAVSIGVQLPPLAAAYNAPTMVGRVYFVNLTAVSGTNMVNITTVGGDQMSYEGTLYTSVSLANAGATVMIVACSAVWEISAMGSLGITDGS